MTWRKPFGFLSTSEKNDRAEILSFTRSVTNAYSFLGKQWSVHRWTSKATGEDMVTFTISSGERTRWQWDITRSRHPDLCVIHFKADVWADQPYTPEEWLDFLNGHSKTRKAMYDLLVYFYDGDVDKVDTFMSHEYTEEPSPFMASHVIQEIDCGSPDNEPLEAIPLDVPDRDHSTAAPPTEILHNLPEKMIE